MVELSRQPSKRMTRSCHPAASQVYSRRGVEVGVRGLGSGGGGGVGSGGGERHEKQWVHLEYRTANRADVGEAPIITDTSKITEVFTLGARTREKHLEGKNQPTKLHV